MEMIESADEINDEKQVLFIKWYTPGIEGGINLK
jgi:hypothetical protein